MQYSGGGELAPSLGERKNFSRTKLTFSIFAAKIYDDLFLVIDQDFRIVLLFSLIFRTLLLKILGRRMHGRSKSTKSTFILMNF